MQEILNKIIHYWKGDPSESPTSVDSRHENEVGQGDSPDTIFGRGEHSESLNHSAVDTRV